ncbi:PilW family protein [Frateuria aurantia]
MKRFEIMRGQAGFSLIELMVAMLLGLLVTAGIIAVFLSTSVDSRQQQLLATLQEDGRFALTKLSDDLSMGNAQYCGSVGGAGVTTSSGIKIDAYLRTPTVDTSSLSAAIFDSTTPWGGSSGGNTYPTQPTAAYELPSFLYMRGYDCTASSCTPVDPSTASGGGIPAMGTAVGSRVIGSDVLTLRYLDSNGGWALDGTKSHVNLTGSYVTSVTIVPQSTETDTLATGDVMMLADCNAGQIFLGAYGSGVFTVKTDLTSAAVTTPSGLSPRLFDLNQDLLNVTYFLQVVSDGNGHTTGALMRRVNGSSTSAEVVRGIERLDFTYGVINSSGALQYLTASQVDSVSSCPAAERYPLSSTPGCLWRFVQSIRINILMDGESQLATLPTNLQNYAYLPDGATTPVAPSAHTITPSSQGFPTPMMRRAFSTTVSLRNVNP